MKPTEKQIELMNFCQSIISTWKHTNDINSPTHAVDLSEFILSDLDWLENDEQESLEELLWDLHIFIRYMKKQLNTSVKVTDKAGNSCVYENLQVASEMTGLTEQALKIRANKNSIPKDGIRVEWVDEHTKRSYQAVKSRRKGNNYELQIIHELTDFGYKGLKSSRSQNRNLDSAKIDIAETEDKLSCYIQCKATKNTPNIELITHECPYKDRPLAIFWKKQDYISDNHEFVMIPKDYFYKLLINYDEKINN